QGSAQMLLSAVRKPLLADRIPADGVFPNAQRKVRPLGQGVEIVIAGAVTQSGAAVCDRRLCLEKAAALRERRSSSKLRSRAIALDDLARLGDAFFTCVPPTRSRGGRLHLIKVRSFGKREGRDRNDHTEYLTLAESGRALACHSPTWLVHRFTLSQFNCARVCRACWASSPARFRRSAAWSSVLPFALSPPATSAIPRW